MKTIPINSIVSLYRKSSETLQDIYNGFNNLLDSFKLYELVFIDIVQLGPHLEDYMKTVEDEDVYYDQDTQCVYVSDLSSHTIGKLCGIRNALLNNKEWHVHSFFELISFYFSHLFFLK